MTTINIDFDVYKAITLKRTNEEITPNDVLRQMFGLPPSTKSSAGNVIASPPNQTSRIKNATKALGWTTKGVSFPIETDFRGNHRGKVHYGRVEEGGLRLGNQVYGSPSAAAISITGNSVNGWIFWECRFPGSSTWKLIKSLRGQNVHDPVRWTPKVGQGGSLRLETPTNPSHVQETTPA